MYFEAELKNKKYKIEVLEKRHKWYVSYEPEDGEKQVYNILKKDFQRIDDAISFLFNNHSYMLDIVNEGLEYTVYARGSYRVIKLYNDESLLHESLKKGGGISGGKELKAGMPGKIAKVLVKPGDEVKAETPILIMEAMKMENEMRAPNDVKIKDVLVEEGQNVEVNTTLITFE